MDLEKKQEEMRARHKRTRKYSPKPIKKSELLALITRRLRDLNTRDVYFISLTRQLAEMKGWIQPFPNSRLMNLAKKDRTEEFNPSPQPAATDFNLRVLEAEAQRK